MGPWVVAEMGKHIVCKACDLRQVVREHSEFINVPSGWQKEIEPTMPHALLRLGHVESGKGVIVPQDVHVRTEPKNAHVKINKFLNF